MTIFYPDYSSFQGNTVVPAGTPAVIAKATEGNYYEDLDYEWYKSQAGKIGATFSGYHFLKANIDPAVQAAYYRSFAGNVPCMLDVETEGSSKPGVDQVVAFITALHGLGGRVWGVYFPQWYWGEVGGDLSRLTAAGAVLISSAYTTYTDSGPGWNAYGGATPAAWQYTSTPIDMNAFKGTPAQLAALINGEDIVTPEDIAAIALATAKEVYHYGEENVVDRGKTVVNVPMGHMLHGTWNALNDVNGAVPQMRSQVNDMFHRPSFDANAVATSTAALVKSTITQAITAGLSSDQVGAQVAEAVVSHLTLALGTK